MFKNFFFFTKGEKTGLIILTLLIFIAFAVNASFNQILPGNTLTESEYGNEIELFKQELNQKDAEKHFEKGNTSAMQKEDKRQKAGQKRSTNLPRNFISIEINSADTADLKQLEGIGSVYSKRIVKFRNYLGGFHSLEQLKEVYGIDEPLFLSIRKNLTLDTAKIRRFNINCDSFTFKFRHPYLSKNEVKAILKARKSKEKIRKEELPLLLSLSEEKWNKLSPYIVE